VRHKSAQNFSENSKFCPLLTGIPMCEFHWERSRFDFGHAWGSDSRIVVSSSNTSRKNVINAIECIDFMEPSSMFY